MRVGKPAYPTHPSSRHHPDYEPGLKAIRCRYCPIHQSAWGFVRITDYESHVRQEHPQEPLPPRRD
jgi:hypothetical protein